MWAMLPALMHSPIRKPSISVPGSRRLMAWLSQALRQTVGVLGGQAGLENRLRRGLVVVGHAQEGHLRGFTVEQRIHGLGSAVARLADRAHRGQPAAVPPQRD